MGRSLHHPVGLIHGSSGEACEGYTLFTTTGGDHATLVDMQGRVCHRWRSTEGIAYAYLLPNGHLLFRTAKPQDVEVVKGQGGSSPALLEMDWEGNVVWEYRNPMLHHDYERLPNGNTLVLLFAEMPPDLSARVLGGYRTSDDPERMLSDVIAEVRPDGRIVSEWVSWEHLDLDEDKMCPLETRREWTHANSLSLTPSGDFLVSFRRLDVLAIVSRSSGNLNWKWGPGVLAHQHHATHLENGRILVFDNGAHRRGIEYSRVVEVDPTTNEVVWEYKGNPALSFYSFHLSGAQRVPNGNTLICEGGTGRLFEVTSSGEIVWEYVNPFYFPDERFGGMANYTFRAHRYGPGDSALEGMDLDPDRYADINRAFAAGSRVP